MTDTITLTRKEAQQVLDALCELEHDTFHPAKVFKHKPSINLLRARLAQPERTNQCGETCERAKLCATCARGIEQPEPEQQLEWDEVFDYATAAYCRSSASKETLRLCFQHRNPQQEQVAIPWTANELMDFAKGIASIYNTPPVRQADSEPVAFICQGNAYMADDVDEYCRAKHTPLYTAPPQREWQGLTDAEVEELECADVLSVRAIEQLLRSKNEQA